MIWVYPEYGGQVAVRMGNLKIVRRNLLSKVPGDWEVYAISSDPYETQDIAAQNAPAIAKARQILRAQTQPNALFPLEWDK